MKIVLKSVFICLIICLFGQCSPNKDSYLKDFEKFIQKTEKNVTSLTDSEWTKIETQYNEYCGKYFDQFKEALSADEKIKIGFLKSQFSSFSLKREAAKLQQQLKGEN